MIAEQNKFPSTKIISLSNERIAPCKRQRKKYIPWRFNESSDFPGVPISNLTHHLGVMFGNSTLRIVYLHHFHSGLSTNYNKTSTAFIQSKIDYFFISV